jgi:hypothetical protein
MREDAQKGQKDPPKSQPEPQKVVLKETHKETNNNLHKNDLGHDALSEEQSKEKIENAEGPEDTAHNSKVALQGLEDRIKQVDAMRKDIEKKFHQYIHDIQTVKDDRGQLLVQEAGTIEERASIVKDYQRDISTSFSKNNLPTGSGVLSESLEVVPANDPDYVRTVFICGVGAEDEGFGGEEENP